MKIMGFSCNLCLEPINWQFQGMTASQVGLPPVLAMPLGATDGDELRLYLADLAPKVGRHWDVDWCGMKSLRTSEFIIQKRLKKEVWIVEMDGNQFLSQNRVCGCNFCQLNGEERTRNMVFGRFFGQTQHVGSSDSWFVARVSGSASDTDGNDLVVRSSCNFSSVQL